MSVTSPPRLVSRLLSDLIAAVGVENVLHHREELVVYECDGFVINKNMPDVVVFPTSTADVVEVVKLCNKYEVRFVPRGAGTPKAPYTLGTYPVQRP